MTMTDEETLAAINEMYPTPETEDTPTEPRGITQQFWLLLAGVGLAALVIGAILGRVTASTTPPTVEVAVNVPETTPTEVAVDDTEPTPAQVATVVPRDMIRPLQGSTPGAFGPFAWPGQTLTAPFPAKGRVANWAWELCDITETGPANCVPTTNNVGGSFTAPPVNTDRYARAVVTVILDDAAAVPFASEPVIIRAWPEGFTPTGTDPSVDPILPVDGEVPAP